MKTLDKLAAIAKSSTNVTLDADMLKMAAGFLGGGDDKDAASMKSLVAGMKGVYVRAYEFDKPGQYAESDVAPLRAYLKQPKWKADAGGEGRQGVDAGFLICPRQIISSRGSGGAFYAADVADGRLYRWRTESRRSGKTQRQHLGIPDIKGLTPVSKA